MVALSLFRVRGGGPLLLNQRQTLEEKNTYFSMIHHYFGIICAEQIYSDMAMGKNAVHWWEFKIAGKRAAPIRIPCPSLLEIKKEAR